MPEIDVKKELTDLTVEINKKLDEFKKGTISTEDMNRVIGEKISGFEAGLKVDGKPVMEYVKTLQAQVDTLGADLKKRNSIVSDDKGEPFGKVVFDLLKDDAGFKEYCKDHGEGKQYVKHMEKALTSASNLVNDTTNDIHLVPPERLTQIVSDTYMTRRVHMRDLIPVGTMTGNAVTWPKETAYSDGSGITAENTAAGETTFTITSQTNLPAVIDTYVEMSNIMLEDFPALVSYLNTKLPANLLETEDNEILNGTGNIKGFLPTHATAFSAASATVTAPQYYDVITMAAKQIALCEFWPTAVIMNPTDVALMKLSKDANENYVFPFIFIQNGRVVVNGIPVIENTAMTSGTYLIGDFAGGCQLWIRRGLTLKFYDAAAAGDVNKHSTTVVLDERVALSCFTNLAFVTDTFAASITELTP